MGLVETLVGTFGPFLIPATVFAVGVLGYGLLYLVSRWLPERGPNG